MSIHITIPFVSTGECPFRSSQNQELFRDDDDVGAASKVPHFDFKPAETVVALGPDQDLRELIHDDDEYPGSKVLQFDFKPAETVVELEPDQDSAASHPR